MFNDLIFIFISYKIKKKEVSFMLKKIFLSIILIFTLFLGIYNNAHSARAYVGPNWEKTSIGVYVPDSSTYGNMMKNAFLKWLRD